MHPTPFDLKSCLAHLRIWVGVGLRATMVARADSRFSFESGFSFEEPIVAGAAADGAVGGGALPEPPEDDDDDEVPSREIAGQEAADYLVDCKLKGRLSAKDVCVISYWFTLAGAEGAASQFFLKSSSQSGGHGNGGWGPKK